jgi:hypothetical protein
MSLDGFFSFWRNRWASLKIEALCHVSDVMVILVVGLRARVVRDVGQGGKQVSGCDGEINAMVEGSKSGESHVLKILS